MVGASDMVGSIRKGMVANLLITSGDIFDKECRIFENWVGGKAFIITDMTAVDLKGSYTLQIDTATYDLAIAGTAEKPTAKVKKGTTDLKASVSIAKKQINLSVTTEKGVVRLSGPVAKETMNGDAALPDGRWVKWSARVIPESADSTGKPPPGSKELKQPDTSIGKVIYPFVSYGWETKPEREEVIFKNAKVWTLEGEGILEGSDVLVKDGKIARIGTNLKAGDARVIDATGLHLTPGIMDEHSHIAMSSTNEFGQVNSAEVRVGDVINPADQSIYRQLSGGVTAAHILHGSANPIGGQSVLIKHRWGSSPEEMKISGQVGFLKHALGENVKRMETRFPNTRMGTEHIIRDAYQRAVDYKKAWKKYNSLTEKQREGLIPPRRDLELDALVDVLDKKSFITCHTYVQSEGNMIMKLAEDFGIRAHTLIHFNEGFKIADKMAEHGAAGSVFSDWWGYKYEVYEGIAYNAATLMQQGVLTCLHSDNPELARRLNQEAGKIVKYGGVDEVEALKLVTLNTARILHLDHRMGSIREGKDADLVLWSGHPLSMYSRAKTTMVDGIIYFDEEQDAKMKLEIEKERNRIIQKILKQSPTAAAGRMAGMKRNGAY
jgi:imidazolonepropionase-like amidohydrolase